MPRAVLSGHLATVSLITVLIAVIRLVDLMEVISTMMIAMSILIRIFSSDVAFQSLLICYTCTYRLIRAIWVCWQLTWVVLIIGVLFIAEPTRLRGEENRSPGVERVSEEQDIQASYLSKMSQEATFHNSSSLHALNVRKEWYGGIFPWRQFFLMLPRSRSTFIKEQGWIA